MIEYLVWGKKAGEEDWIEHVLKTGCDSMKTAQRWKQIAEQDGFLQVRISRLDLSVTPEFGKASLRTTGEQESRP